MKKFFAASLLLISFCSAAFAESWGDLAKTSWTLEHSGTEGDPYIIRGARDLAGLAKIVNDGDDMKGKFLRLEDDVDLLDIEWIPIGWNISNSENRGFAGNFDGAGHSIAKMKITRVSHEGGASSTIRSDAAGLFGYLTNDATVANLFVEGSEHDNKTSFNGLLTGYSAPKLARNCVVSGDITNGGGAAYGGNSYVGGLGGTDGRGSYENCVAYGSFRAIGSAQNYSSGIIGYASNSSGATSIKWCVGMARMLERSGNSLGPIGGICSGLVQTSRAEGDFWIYDPNDPNSPSLSATIPEGKATRAESPEEIPASAVMLDSASLYAKHDVNAPARAKLITYPIGGISKDVVSTWTFDDAGVSVRKISEGEIEITSPTAGEKSFSVRVAGLNGISASEIDGERAIVLRGAIVFGGVEARDVMISHGELSFESASASPKELRASVEPKSAQHLLTWKSSDESVATVDSGGVVRAVGAGEATITASAGGKSASCAVKVAGSVGGGSGGCAIGASLAIAALLMIKRRIAR